LPGETEREKVGEEVCMLVRGKQRYREGGTGSREGKQGGSILCLETDGRVNKDDWTVGFVEKKTAVLA
jgi:hypothetical protein